MKYVCKKGSYLPFICMANLDSPLEHTNRYLDLYLLFIMFRGISPTTLNVCTLKTKKKNVHYCDEPFWYQFMFVDTFRNII